MAALKDKVVSGVFWQGLSNIGSYGLNFVISVILSRLLATGICLRMPSCEDFKIITT